MIVVGIDPGLKGAMACVGDDGEGSYPLPHVGKSPDLDAIREFYRELPSPSLIVLERIQGGKAQAGQMLMAVNYGQILGQIRTLGYRLIEVAPQAWKRDLKLGKDKGEAILRARDLFPTTELKRSERCRKDDDGLAEALLLAHWGRLHGGLR